jgi:hypothetical protein
MAGAPLQREREASPGTFGSEPRPEAQQSDPLRARIAGELRNVDRMQRMARPVALIVFTLLGLLALLQLYSWSRVEQLTALSQRREERTAAALASMQEAIDKQRVILDEAIDEMESPGQSHKKPQPAAKDVPESAAPAAGRETSKHGKTIKDPPPEAHKTAPRAVSARPVAEPPAADRPAPPPPQATQQSRQRPIIEYQALAANRLDQSSNRPDPSVPPAGQSSSREVTESQAVRVNQADTVIARDHSEIERLRRLGKRDYVEFTLVRSGSRQEVAPDIRLELKKVDSKRLRCAVNIYAEDYEYPTDLGINEAVVFPVRAMWESVELVINKVEKDTVAGYLTARKGVLLGR